MSKLEITLLGKFSMTMDGADILSALENSKKKTAVVQFLLLNKDRDTANLDIFYTLWPHEENINPESSFKTLISRMRAALAQLGLKNVILTRHGFYKWNTALNCHVDIFELEELCRELADVKELDGETTAKFDRVMELYVGDLLPEAAAESWLESKAAYYHNLYIETVNRYVQLLKEKKMFGEVTQVTQRALENDAFDAALNLELMNALMELGKSSEALAQYNYATGLHNTYMGKDQSAQMLSFYKRLIKINADLDNSLNDLCAELTAKDDDEAGALVCDFSVLKEIYRINAKNLKRIGGVMYLALIAVEHTDEREPDALRLDNVMSTLLQTLKSNLRRGDTVARYSLTQYAVLLPSFGSADGKAALERVKKAFYADYSAPEYIINYKIKPMQKPTV